MNSNVTLEEIWALFRETDRKMQDTDRLLKELVQEKRETDRQLRELGKQIDGLGNKFGSFTEGLALPSMEKILRRRFGVDTVAPSVRVARGGQHLELDVLAYANGEVNAAYVVEVKSHLREEHIQQLLEILEQFADWFPEHRDKQLYGILAAVHIPAAAAPARAGTGPLPRPHPRRSVRTGSPRRFPAAPLRPAGHPARVIARR